LALWLIAGVATAQPPSPSPVAASLADQIAGERSAVTTTLDEDLRTLKSAAGEASDALRHEIELLQQLDLLYGQQLELLKQQQELTLARDQGREALQQMHTVGVPDAAPYSLLMLDRVQDELETVEDDAEAVDAAVRGAEEALQQAQDLAAQRERERRAAREAFETNGRPEHTAQLDAALRQVQLESRVAQEQVRVRDLELTNEKVSREGRQTHVAMLHEKVELVARDAGLRRDELDAQVADLEKDGGELRRSLAAAKRELDTAGRRVMMAQQRAAQQSEPNPVSLAEVEARRRAQETLQLEVNSLGQRLQRLVELRQVWMRRYQVSEEKPTPAQLAQWGLESRQAIEQVAREERIQRSRLAQLRKMAKTLRETIIEQAPTAPEVAKWLIDEQEHLQEQSTVYEAHLTSLETVHRLHDKLLRQIVSRSSSIDWRERLGTVWDRVQAAWRFEITAVDDRPITIGKIVLGLFLFTLGLSLARWLSRWLGRRLLPRLGLDVHASSALQSISFYILLWLLTLFALNVINVPLTIFTFVGGALAIGVGFGSQNIVNNFISGLILLAERPIKVGDLIDVDGTQGTVERIGPRSTRVLGAGNVEILVPNSAFLEKNVVNWTLSSNAVRTHVNVGVAYGSPVDEVTRLLLAAVGDHEQILKEPAADVVFADFGENALQFELHFWIRVRTPMQKRLLESDVRYRIERRFAEGGITLAFPQRDVHLNAGQPLTVRVVRE
jgi:small-conductance mechanosensitive channel